MAWWSENRLHQVLLCEMRQPWEGKLREIRRSRVPLRVPLKGSRRVPCGGGGGFGGHSSMA